VRRSVRSREPTVECIAIQNAVLVQCARDRRNENPPHCALMNWKRDVRVRRVMRKQVM
jgi:hypothetical protein